MLIMFRGCKYSDAQACHLHVYVSLKVALASSHVTFAHENLEKVKPSRPEGVMGVVLVDLQ